MVVAAVAYNFQQLGLEVLRFFGAPTPSINQNTMTNDYKKVSACFSAQESFQQIKSR
jgi:hypothetical protein